MSDPFTRARPRLMGLAYRMLGSRAEAEDVVQEAWLRWSASDASQIENATAWLAKVVANLCLDVLKSSRMKREAYVGPWLPEPVVTEGGLFYGEPVDPKGISLAFLCLLERLSPLERVVYLLAEAFEYSHEEIGAFLAKEPAAIRQLLHRARGHIQEKKIRYAPDKEAHIRMLEAFSMACASGDSEALGRLLASDVVAYSDGGGRVRAAIKPIYGAEFTARMMLALQRKASPEITYAMRELNGWPCVVLTLHGAVMTVFDIETDGVQIFRLHAVVNPDKLGALG